MDGPGFSRTACWGTVAELCAKLLPAADDVRILAMSRGPLAVPDLHDLAGAARAGAVNLFADQARSAGG
jgi:hypothetical protein